MSKTPYNFTTQSILKAVKAENHLSVHEPLMQILQNYTMIVMPDDDFAEKLAWCLENCNCKFRDLSVADGRAWYFQDDQDAMIFTMRWS